MNRREFVAVVVGAAAWPLAARAQQPKAFRVGYLTAVSKSAEGHVYAFFEQGMRALGYVEGRDVMYETRWTEGNFERLPVLAAELVGLKLDVILAGTTPSALALKHATRTIPIVLVSLGDPVGTGLVDSLARPGGNITGSTNMVVEMAGKRLELMKEAIPGLSRVALLGHPDDPIIAGQIRHAESTARSLKIEVFAVQLRAIEELERAFETIIARRADGVQKLSDALSAAGAKRTAELSLRHRIPTMGARPLEVQAGLIMSYAPDRPEQYRQAATFVDKILKGAKPGDSRRTADQGRAGDQPQNRQGARPHRPAIAPGESRRGD
jgi:putative tryptophan/tyrosine transport system substrate-binding protein